MELRAFWSVIVRWRWVVIAVTAAAVLASGALAIVSPPGYKAKILLAFSAPAPAANVTLPGFDERNSFLYSEEVVEDFTKIVPSGGFSQGVAKRLPFPMDARQIERSWTAKKQAHHLLSIEASAPTESQAVALAKAAGDELVQNGQAYFKALNTPQLGVVIDSPAESEGLAGRLVDILFIVGRVVVGVIVALGLAFLLNYLDDHINDPREAELLGFRVLGAIPRSNGWWQAPNGTSRGKPRTAPTIGAK